MAIEARRIADGRNTTVLTVDRGDAPRGWSRPVPILAGYDALPASGDSRSTSLTEQAATLAIVGACHSLHLPTVRAQHRELADAAVRDRLTQQAFLAEVLGAELDERDGRRRERRIAEAKFPRMKLLDDFDFGGRTVHRTGHPRGARHAHLGDRR